jgi:hypothetical protein
VSGLTIGPGDASGIVDVVTGFGSICVNGVRLDVDVATPVSERPDGGIAAMGQPIDLLPNARVPDRLTPGTLVQVSPAPLRAIRFSPHPQWAAH